MPPPFQEEDSWSIVSNLWWNKNQVFFSHQFPFSSLDLECFSLCVTLFLGELSSLQIDHSSIFFLLWIGLYTLLFLWSWLLIGFVKHSEKTSWMGASVFFPTTSWWSWLLIGYLKHSEKTSWMGASVSMPTITNPF